jgi:hypothetical protein
MNNSNSNTDIVTASGTERSGLQTNNSNPKLSSNTSSKVNRR